MRWNQLLWILPLAIAGTWTVSSVAQGGPGKCSNRAIAGTYSYTCTGMVLLPNVAAPVPIAILGVAHGDAAGNWHAAATMSFNGTFMPQYATTDPNLGGVPAVVKSDCSGTITYQTYTGDPNATDSQYMGPLPINFVIMNNGSEIKGLPTNPGYTVTCHLVRQRNED
jgi:hypothetical protein